MITRNLFFSVLIVLLPVVLLSQDWTRSNIKEFYSFDDFEEEILKIENDTTYVINFWATWCGPCVKELPYFEEVNAMNENEKIKVILVSLDFKNQIEKRLIPFLNKNQIKSQVVLLLDGKESEWIDRVDSSWSGAIPITIVKNKNEEHFYERVFHSSTEIQALIAPFIKN